jgi:hypothetical protein
MRLVNPPTDSAAAWQKLSHSPATSNRSGAPRADPGMRENNSSACCGETLYTLLKTPVALCNAAVGDPRTVTPHLRDDGLARENQRRKTYVEGANQPWAIGKVGPGNGAARNVVWTTIHASLTLIIRYEKVYFSNEN